MLVIVQNDHQNLKTTNYWQTAAAKKGLLFLSFNAGAARLLVPKSEEKSIPEMKTGNFVSICHSTLADRRSYRLTFDDLSNSPYCVEIMLEQVDRKLRPEDDGMHFPFKVYTESGLSFELDAVFRYF